MESLDRQPRQRTDLAARVIGGEAVVVDAASSRVHELNPVATFVWERCDGTSSGWGIVDAVVEAFAVEHEVAARDVAELLQTLQARGLLDLSSPAP